MALREVDGPAGAPWEPSLAGRFDKLTVESELLAGNPLGDPARRPLYVYVSPGAGSEPAPAVYPLQGYSGQLDAWLARKPFEPTTVERLDRMFAAGTCAPAVVVFVDAWTSLAALSSSTHPPPAAIWTTSATRWCRSWTTAIGPSGRRAVAGHSSGGYGAMVTAMLRPDVISAFASHAGDALFECCYLPDFRVVARTLRDRFEGSYEVLLEHVKEADPFDWSRYGAPLSVYAMAAAYSDGALPFDVESGRLIDEVWERWLDWDPVRMAPRHAAALRGMRRIYLDAGRADEFFLDLGAEASRRRSRAWESGTRSSCSTVATAERAIATRARSRELVLALGDP